MKILLIAINSKFIHTNPAVYSLKSYCKDLNAEIKIREYTINQQKDQILGDIYEQSADILCFSTYIWNLSYVEDISREYHKIKPYIPLYVGGPEVSFETTKFLSDNQQFTGVMIGEGEQTFKELVQAYLDFPINITTSSLMKCSDALMDSLKNIPGLALNTPNGVFYTDSRSEISMNSLVFPYGDESVFDNKIVYYESSRGCPFSCSYCLSSIDRKLRFKDLDIVKKELSFFLSKKVPQVKFVDRTFNCNHSHALEILKFLKENDNGITNFHFEIAADLCTDEELNIIKGMRKGLIQLEIGVQSTNPQTLEAIKRKMDFSKVTKVVKEIQTFENTHQHLDLIAGLPYEDYASFKKSFNDVYAIKPDQLQLGFLKVLKGSFMYECIEEYGLVYKDQPPYEVMATKWLSFDDVLRLKRIEEMVEVYYNSGQFSMGIKMLELFFETPFEMFEALGDFYHSHGYFEISHTRNARAEIILEFAENNAFSVNDTNLLKEALVYDLYRREKCKTRPSFADDCSKWRELSHEYCKNGKLSHLEAFNYDFPSESVRTMKELPQKLSSPKYVCFDYQNKTCFEVTDSASHGGFSNQ